MAAPDDTPLMQYDYTYNSAGNLLTKETEHGMYSYDYDLSSRLTGADNPVLDDEAYTYDDVGNRRTALDTSGYWQYTLNNELAGYDDVDDEYDANGNLIVIRIAGTVAWTYVYNPENRLIHAEDATGLIVADYYYDPFGRRLWKEVNGSRTYFFYSDEGLIAEYDENGTEIRSYGYQPNSTWTTDPLWLKTGGEYYWYQNDHLGTPQKLVDMSGQVVWSAQYESFGKATIEVETIINNLRFPGQYEDVETGLHYNFQRYYHPGVGRYVSVDPIGLRGGNNLFLYASNNPLTHKDIYGLDDSESGDSELWCCPDSKNGKTGCCGPDVTEAVNLVLDNIRGMYDAWGESGSQKQLSACTMMTFGKEMSRAELSAISMKDLRVPILQTPSPRFMDLLSEDDRFHASFAWDISPLFTIGHAKGGLGVGKLPTELWPVLQGKIQDGAGQDGSTDCRWTVTYNGGCYNAGYLSYLMWGLMNSLCQKSFQDEPWSTVWERDFAQAMAIGYKAVIRGNYTAAADLLPIIDAGYSGGSPYPVSFTPCKVDSQAGKVPPDVFDCDNWTWRPNKH